MSNRIDTFANRLDIAMRNNNINQTELAERTQKYPKSISQSLLNKYLKGKAFARQDKLTTLAEILNTNEAWLMGYDVSSDSNQSNRITETCNINVIDLITNKVIDTIPFIIDPNYDAAENYFAVKSIDESMAPLLDIGDIAIILKENNYTTNGTYLLKVKNSPPIIRKIVDVQNKIELHAMNPYYPVQKDINKKDIKILGRIIKSQNESYFK